MSATAAAPSLRPRPKSSPSSRYWRELNASDLQQIQLQVIVGQATLAGARAVISWDHRQVLDTLRISAERVVKASNGVYPKETQDVLRTVHHLPNCKIAQIVLSYCHIDYTVQNVCACTSNQAEIAKTLISRKPTGPTGKLAVLQRLFEINSPVFHVDDSPEVLEEFQQFLASKPSCIWKVIGISVPRKRVIPGIVCCKNVGEALYQQSLHGLVCHRPDFLCITIT